MKKAFVLSFLLFATSFEVFACECIPSRYGTIEEMTRLLINKTYKDSDIVFYGKHLGNQKFQIIKQYKGIDSKLVIQTPELSVCDYTFTKDNKYLVYGNLDETGYLWTDICLPNSLIKKRNELKASTQFFNIEN